MPLYATPIRPIRNSYTQGSTPIRYEIVVTGLDLYTQPLYAPYTPYTQTLDPLRPGLKSAIPLHGRGPRGPYRPYVRRTILYNIHIYGFTALRY